MQLYTPLIRKEYAKDVYNQILTLNIGQGEKTKEFEREIAKYKNRKYAVAVTSGTAAILCGIFSLDIEKDTTILYPSYGFIAGANVIEFLGYKIKLCKINNVTMCMNPIDVEENLKNDNSIKVVYFINHNGYSGSHLEKIHDICNKYKVYLFEDSACALDNPQGAQLGDISILSFSVPKIITTGQGGMVLTDNEDIYTNLIRIRDQGDENWRQTKIHRFKGLNFKYTDIQACLGLSQLKIIDELIEEKRKIRQLYEYYFKELIIPEVGNFHWFNLIWCNTTNYNRLLAKGIPCSKQYKPIYHHPKFNYLEKDKDADWLYENIVYMPSGLGLTEKEIKKIAKLYGRTIWR